MPAKKGHRIVIWVAFFVVSAVIAGQMLYPLDRAMPFASVHGAMVGFLGHEKLAEVINTQFDATKVKVITDGKSIDFALKSAGAEPETEQMIARLTDYPFWQRFIPLSLLWQIPQVQQADVYYTDSVLREFSEKSSAQLSYAPSNARLALEKGMLVAKEDQPGYHVTAEQIHDALASAKSVLGATTSIYIVAQRLAAEHPMSEFMAVKTQAETALKRQVTIQVVGRTFSPDKAEMASWLMLDTGSDGKVTLRVDIDKVKAYLATIDKRVGTPAGQTDITIVDGRETGRVTGAVGKAVDKDSVAAVIAPFVLEGKGSPLIQTQLVDVQPSVIFNSKYTTTQQGLQAYLDDLGRSKDVHVMIQQLDGGHWSASTRAYDSIPSGSTYKLFVALMLFDKMQKGEIHWTDPILDTDVDTCFDRMTIASTNPCAEQWLADWGRSNVNDFVYAHGFSTGTTFTNPEATHTTAADLTKYMIGLNDGSLVADPYRSRLLHSLSVHPYRYGIPTGSKGTVQDKVGFLWDYVHDTAIVHHPQGTYIMTVMTKGQSYAAIAAITREVERIMYP